MAELDSCRPDVHPYRNDSILLLFIFAAREAKFVGERFLVECYFGCGSIRSMDCIRDAASDYSALSVSGLTPRWSQRRLPLEFMDSLSYTTIIEFAESLARRRGSALDR